MKKVFALLMVLVLACALCVPALAANTKDYTKADLAALSGKVPAELKSAYDSVVNTMQDGEKVTVDVDAVKAVKARVENAMANETNPATLQATLDSAAKDLDSAVTGLSVRDLKVSVDALSGKVTVSATVSVNDKAVSVSAAATAPNAKDEPKKDSGSSGSSNTTSNTAAAASSVIKATGFDTTAVVMVVLAIAGVLGVAAVKARKLD